MLYRPDRFLLSELNGDREGLCAVDRGMPPAVRNVQRVARENCDLGRGFQITAFKYSRKRFSNPVFLRAPARVFERRHGVWTVGKDSFAADNTKKPAFDVTMPADTCTASPDTKIAGRSSR